MLGTENTTISPVMIIKAKIQARVAKLLTARSTLVDLATKGSLTVASEAKLLLKDQDSLEEDLTKTLKDLDQAQKSAWTFSVVISAGEFFYNMEKHLKAVDKLSNKASGIKTDNQKSFNWKSIVIGSFGIFALGYTIFGLRKKK